MFFKKKTEAGLPLTQNLRRRFHHVLLSKRKEKSGLSSFAQIARPKRKFGMKPAHNAKTLKIKKVLYALGLVLALVACVYLAFFSTFFSVEKISLQKTGRAVPETSFSPFLERLKGRNLLFINSEALAKEIENGFLNEVKSVKIKSSYPDKVIVEVNEYPVLLNLNVHTEEKEQKLVINELGYIIFENAEMKEVPILKMTAPKPFLKGTIGIAKEKLDPIALVYKKWEELFGIKIIEGEWRKSERELHIFTKKKFWIWIDLTADTEKQLLKLKRALPKLDIFNEPLEYIDLRIAGGDNEKVIFKRR